MKCPTCGVDVPVGRSYCSSCGGKLDFVAPTAAGGGPLQPRRVAEEPEGLTYLANLALVLAVLGVLAAYGVNYWFSEQLDLPETAFPAVELPAPPAPSGAEIPLPAPELGRLSGVQGPPTRAFGYRFGRFRQVLQANQVNAKADVLAEEGLKRIAGWQDPKTGAWQVEGDEYKLGSPGLTGLALLAFFARGHVWEELGGGLTKSRYAPQIERGLRYIVQEQDPQTGMIGSGDFQLGLMYNQSFGTLALVEAAGLSGDPFLRERAQAGLDFLQRTQRTGGGWNYTERISNAREDTSISVWAIQALLAGREAGFELRPEVIEKARSFMQAATDETNDRVRYDTANDHFPESLSAALLMLGPLLGEPVDTPVYKRIATRFLKTLPKAKPNWGGRWRPGVNKEDDKLRAETFDPYRLYFQTHGLYIQGGEDWQIWQPALYEFLNQMQNNGVWTANDLYSAKAGRTYATALCVLALSAPYRL
jgi:hypothetical protein